MQCGCVVTNSKYYSTLKKKKMTKLKKGDWCFCEYKLQQIMSVDENRITEVSDGFFRMSGHDLSDRCFPLDLKIKRCSDTAEHWSNKFHNLKNNGLNHPDLNRKLIDLWVDACNNIGDDIELQKSFDKMDEFGKSVCSKVSELNYEEVEGVRLFRN